MPGKLKGRGARLRFWPATGRWGEARTDAGPQLDLESLGLDAPTGEVAKKLGSCFGEEWLWHFLAS